MIVPVPWLERVPSYKEQQQQLTREGPLHLRLPRLSAAAERGHHDLQGGRGAGGGGPGAAHRADARGRAPLQSPLRPGVPGAEDPAHRGPARAGHRRPQDVEVLRQRGAPEGPARGRARRRSSRWSPTPRASGAPIPATRTSAPSSTCTRRSRRRRRRSGRPQGCRTAGIGCLDCKGRLLDHLLQRLEGIHARRPEFAARPDTVWDILPGGLAPRAGGRRVRRWSEVRSAMKIAYPIR